MESRIGDPNGFPWVFCTRRGKGDVYRKCTSKIFRGIILIRGGGGGGQFGGMWDFCLFLGK